MRCAISTGDGKSGPATYRNISTVAVFLFSAPEKRLAGVMK